MIFWICLSSTLLITVTAARLLTCSNTYSHTSIHTNAFIHIHIHIHTRTHQSIDKTQQLQTNTAITDRHSNYRQTQYDLSRTHTQILTNGQIQTHTAGRHTETADTHRQ